MLVTLLTVLFKVDDACFSFKSVLCGTGSVMANWVFFNWLGQVEIWKLEFFVKVFLKFWDFFSRELIHDVFSSEVFENSCTHKWHNWKVLFHMNWFNMPFQITPFSADLVTNVTFKWFLFLMNRVNMYFQSCPLVAAVVANFTFEWLLFFMNWFNMSFQITPFSAGLVTNVTFKWFLFLMNWLNMYFQATL